MELSRVIAIQCFTGTTGALARLKQLVHSTDG
jgi:hypothetical protein